MIEENKLPNGWQIVNLKSITDSIQYGYTESSSKENIGPKFLRITDIQDNTVLWDKVPYCKIDSESKGKYLLKEGDLVFARTGATVGKSFLIKGEIPEAVFASYLIRVRVNQEINEKYLSCFFHSPNYWSQITEGQVGIGQPNVNGTKLGQLKISIAPIEEQQLIVSKIEELLSDLDNGKQQLLIAKQQLKVYRQSLLKWAFEGKLTNKNVKEGELPQGWKMVLLKEVVEVNPKIPNREKIDTKLVIQFVPMKLVEQIINKVHLVETRKYCDVLKGSYTPFIDGDILFAKVTPCMENGKIAIVENLKNGIGFGSSEFHIARCSDAVLNKFIFHFIVQDRFRNEAANEMTGAVGLRRVPKQFLENYSIPLPPIEEQKLIVDELESKLTVCDKIGETISQSLLQAETLRQSILKQAFEGKLI